MKFAFLKKERKKKGKKVTIIVSKLDHKGQAKTEPKQKGTEKRKNFKGHASVTFVMLKPILDKKYEAKLRSLAILLNMKKS